MVFPILKDNTNKILLRHHERKSERKMRLVLLTSSKYKIYNKKSCYACCMYLYNMQALTTFQLKGNKEEEEQT